MSRHQSDSGPTLLDVWRHTWGLCRPAFVKQHAATPPPNFVVTLCHGYPQTIELTYNHHPLTHLLPSGINKNGVFGFPSSISQCVVLGRFARASFSFAYPFFLFFFFAILLPLALFVPPVSFPFPHLSFYRSTSLSLYLSIFMALASVTHLASAVTDRSSNEPRRLLFQSVTWQCKFEGFGNGLLQEHRCHFGYL